MRIQYSPEFDRRLDAFYSYIRDELKSPQSAVTNANSILDQCSLLAIMPRMGTEIHTEDGIGTGIRMLFLENHVALYRISEDFIEIVTLLDARTKEFTEILKEIRTGVFDQ